MRMAPEMKARLVEVLNEAANLLEGDDDAHEAYVHVCTALGIVGRVNNP